MVARKRRLRAWLHDSAWDAVAIAGAGLIAGGLWCIYPPAALVATGGALVFFGLWGAAILARERARRKPGEE